MEEVIEHRCAELGSTEAEVWPLGVLYPYEVAAAFLHRGDGVEEHVIESTKVQENGSVTPLQTYQLP